VASASEWFLRSALADLLASDFSLPKAINLYRVHDLLLPHKRSFLAIYNSAGKISFGARFEVLLYDLTSTYLRAIRLSSQRTSAIWLQS